MCEKLKKEKVANVGNFDSQSFPTTQKHYKNRVVKIPDSLSLAMIALLSKDTPTMPDTTMLICYQIFPFFVGHMELQIWTSGDICRGFQIQVGSFNLHTALSS